MACCCFSGLVVFHSLVVIGILARTITPHWLTNFVLAASGALGQPSASTSVTTCLPSIFLVGRRCKVIIFFIGISRHIQERISCLSIFFSDWLGGVGPRIFVYCVQHILLGDLVITEVVHP